MTAWEIIERWVSEPAIPSATCGSPGFYFWSWQGKEMSSVCSSESPHALPFSKALCPDMTCIYCVKGLSCSIASASKWGWQQETGKRMTVRSGIPSPGSHPPSVQWTPWPLHLRRRLSGQPSPYSVLLRLQAPLLVPVLLVQRWT